MQNGKIGLSVAQGESNAGVKVIFNRNGLI
jgi:hypothetical protein